MKDSSGALDFGQEFLGFGGPNVGSRVVVVFLDECHNRVDQLPDSTERAATQPFVGDFAEPALDQIQPRTARGNEMNVESPMPFQPRLDLGMLVSGVVVHDQVQVQVRWCFGVDQLQELDPLLMPVLGHAGSDQAALRQFDRGKQGGRAVAFVIVSHRSAPAFL